jgi:hypothetical protein
MFSEKQFAIHLESAVLVFHMSGVNPESSGLRELRVLWPCYIAAASGLPPFSQPTPMPPYTRVS